MALPSLSAEKDAPAASTDWGRPTCWPNELETLLLQAGLCEIPGALAAWHEFCAKIENVEELDHACYRLFPLVAGNLQNCGVSIPHQARILGVLRHTWARNQRLLGEIAPLLRALRAAEIRLLVLKGAALTALYRQQGGVRAMVDVDILIQPRELSRAVEILQARGCTSKVSLTPRHLSELIRFRHELTLKTPGDMELDIHWYLVSDARHLDVEDRFWQDAVPCCLAGVEAETLHPADQLLHTCLHGTQWNEVSPVRWLADATVLIRAGVDWKRLEEQARRLERIEPVRDTLLYLDRLEIQLPAGMLEHWRRVEITKLEKGEGGYRQYRPNSRERTQQLAWIYLRLKRGDSLAELLRHAPDYMRQIHHFRAYSRRITFLGYLLFLFLTQSPRPTKSS